MLGEVASGEGGGKEKGCPGRAEANGGRRRLDQKAERVAEVFMGGSVGRRRDVACEKLVKSQAKSEGARNLSLGRAEDKDGRPLPDGSAPVDLSVKMGVQ
ncbi:unnamed protein product [Cutaneotrichosporon oleaginosum]